MGKIPRKPVKETTIIRLLQAMKANLLREKEKPANKVKQNCLKELYKLTLLL